MALEFIYVCSPYGGWEENYEKAKLYGSFVFSEGKIPVIPHTMYHGVLNDSNPSERKQGIEAGKQLLKICQELWVFGESGRESAGMKEEIDKAQSVGIPIKYIDGSKALQPNRKAEELSKCLKHYEKITSQFVSGIICADIQDCLNTGISADVICECINIAARKRAHWNYVNAILKRCKAEKVYTIEEFNEKCGKSPKRKPQNDFAAYDIDAFEKMLDEVE